jgi:hypothetical protein
MSQLNQIENLLSKDLDKHARVKKFKPSLSPYLSNSYNLYKANVLGEGLIFAEPTKATTDYAKLIKGVAALNKALGINAVLFLPNTPTRTQRKNLLEVRQAFATAQGDYYIPQLALLLSQAQEISIKQKRVFTPTQQLVFLYCLYASDGQQINAADIQKALGLSSGSVSYALSALVDYELIQYTTGGKTARKKTYYIESKADFYRYGIGYFGNPVKETIEAPLSCASESWPKSGLSALSELSNLLPPNTPYFAATSKEVMDLGCKSDDGQGYCTIQVLKYNPALFAKNEHVDPLTTLLTLDDADERISIALKQALGGFEWYQD